MTRTITMTINTTEKIFEFSDGYWMPFEYLYPINLHNISEMKRLYLKNWFTKQMFNEIVKTFRNIGYNMDEVLIESGRWEIYKEIKNGEKDHELELYLSNNLYK
jgi:hypothetical protein